MTSPSALDIITALSCGRGRCACAAAVRKGTGKTHCPGHPDVDHPNLSVSEGSNGKVLFKDFAGCDQDRVLDALRERGLWPERRERPGPGPKRRERIAGFTVAEYAKLKQLPVDFLHSIGVGDITYNGAPAVRMAVLDRDGSEITARIRIGPSGTEDTRARGGDKLALYGLQRLSQAEGGEITILEGESDPQTLWLHGEQALGVPGASAAKPDWFDVLEAVPVIYLVREPDAGGEKACPSRGSPVVSSYHRSASAM